ncbi:hypothetical protein CEXT_593591 [Caerostris extrusa]|uniref:Uncharacterized protein n=1 Tax=Caerostris extrusa TaxID=172846 RepID=A0AAV4PVE8_CAEEX|nr:hypothetical protein CEXT_593591 [Caerostris extrusa]
MPSSGFEPEWENGGYFDVNHILKLKHFHISLKFLLHTIVVNLYCDITFRYKSRRLFCKYGSLEVSGNAEEGRLYFTTIALGQIHHRSLPQDSHSVVFSFLSPSSVHPIYFDPQPPLSFVPDPPNQRTRSRKVAFSPSFSNSREKNRKTGGEKKVDT